MWYEYRAGGTVQVENNILKDIQYCSLKSLRVLLWLPILIGELLITNHFYVHSSTVVPRICKYITEGQL